MTKDIGAPLGGTHLRGGWLDVTGSVVVRDRSALREPWIVATLVFVAVTSVLCTVASVDDPSLSLIVSKWPQATIDG
ncbi:hypothetical protein ACFVFJ_47920 [Streptomyces sp. NPDC057717]|uniref:hypothetical protein n=1 Tax=Streptomyces sp. NPDC057717 TaxID=3346224 RepID=UPI003679F18C